MPANALSAVALTFARVLQVMLVTFVKQIFDRVNPSDYFSFHPFVPFFCLLGTCSINCSPGYCFSNPASQPPYACYCTDLTIQLKSCAA